MTLSSTLLFGGACRRHDIASEVRRRADSIRDRFGVTIGYGPPDTFFVPPYKSSDARVGGALASQAAPEELPPALDGIEKALPAYPPGFFAKVCPAIFVCGTLSFQGVGAGGAYGPSWILLVASRSYGTEGVFQNALYGVHHEFSSLIWHRTSMLPIRWTELLPRDWQPLKTVAAAMKHGERRSGDLAAGFLTAYAEVSAENDFNTYAEKIFVEPKFIVETARAHPTVAQKVALLMAAYVQSDARLEHEFAGLGLSEFRSKLARPILDESAPPSQIQLPKPTIVR